MTTAPRLLALLPDVTVQRARWSASCWGIVLPHGDDRGEVALVAPPELGPGLPDGVLEAVGEGRRGGRDDVRVRAHRGPFACAVRGLDRHPRPGAGGGVGIEDPDLVVVEVDGVEDRVERAERLPEGGIQRVHRAVAIGRRVEDLAVNLDLDGGLGPEVAGIALLDEAGVVEDPEGRRITSLVAPDEELEARLRALELQALVLEPVDERRELLRVDAIEVRAELASPDRRVGLAAELGYDQPPLIAHDSRIDVLVAPLDLGHGRAVDAALFRPRPPAHP